MGEKQVELRRGYVEKPDFLFSVGKIGFTLVETSILRILGKSCHVFIEISEISNSSGDRIFYLNRDQRSFKQSPFLSTILEIKRIIAVHYVHYY